MKKIVILLIFSLFGNIAFSQTENYIYNPNGTKIYFQNNSNVKYFKFTNTLTAVQKQDFLTTLSAKSATYEEVATDLFKIDVPQNSTSTIQILNNKEIVEFCSSEMLYTQDSTIQWAGSHIFVHPKENHSLVSLLNSLNVSYSDIDTISPYLPNQYAVKIIGENAVDCANRLFESGKFIYSQPAFYRTNILHNTYYSQQWGLNNTGQSGGTIGIDINVEPAWNITNGDPNIKVAVIDNGIDLDHEDLAENILSGYDALELGSNGGYSGNDNHGTACAGIIAAANNSIGIKGIANKCKIIPIRMHTGSTFFYDLRCVNSVIYAVENNASVLSCSWGGGSDFQQLTNAINTATTQGRNGKGCVVVFASGNNNGNEVKYPSSLPNVISVGAISPCGERKSPSSCDGETLWGSNYGLGLDVVAPGVLIPTTDINSGYVNDYNGTSSACPHVAGVAALLLSYRPNLMWYQVKQAIERTARKIGQSDNRYTYVDYAQFNIPLFTGYFPNGSWNPEVGYGLVDAYAALSYVDLLYPTADLYIKDNAADNGLEPNLIESGVYYNSPDIWLEEPDRIFPSYLNGIINPEPGQTYKVRVRVKNNSNIASTANKKLYLRWSIAGTPLMWKSSWFDNGRVCDQPKSGVIDTVLIPSIPAGETRIISTRWTVPSFGNGHTCISVPGSSWRLSIAAVVEDGRPTSGIDATAISMDLFAASNNNVAWKNYTVLSTETPVAVATFKNPFSNKLPFDLKMEPVDDETESMLDKYVNIYMILSEELMQAWKAGGKKGENIEVLDGNRIRLKSFKARLKDVMLEKNADVPYAIEIEYKDYYNTEKPLELKMTQMCYKTDQVDSVLSGLTYSIYLNEKFDIKVEAKDDVIALEGDNIQFTAESDESDAVFTWYNMSGDSIGSGSVLNVQAEQTQQYYLRGYSSTANAYGYDSVALVVRNGAITSLSPNPATNQVVVSYSITNQVQSGTVQIANTNGIVLSSTPFTASQTSTTINLQNLVAGQYSVRLVSSTGEVMDGKTLIVQ